MLPKIKLFYPIFVLVLVFLGVKTPAFAAPAFAADATKDAAKNSPVTASYGRDDEGRRMGDPKAPIVIVEYSSLTCPHCADFALNVLPGVKKNWIDTGKAQFIYRDFPWDQQALQAASLARCVAPNKFFAFIDLLFREQKNWVRPGETTPNSDALIRYAKLAGLGEDKAKSCLGDKKLQNDAVTQRSHGQNLFQVDSTPWVMVNGARTSAYNNSQEFEAALKKLAK